MTTKNAYVKARINDQLKAHVNEILEKIGINASDAINLFYRYIELNQGLPFEVKIPNKETKKVIDDLENGRNVEHFKKVDDLFEDLGI